MADISYSKKVNSSRFEDIIKEIIEIYGKGYITTKEIQPEKDEEKLCLKEVRLHGSRARGAGYRVRKVLSSEYEIIDIKENDQRFPEPTDPTILFLDLKDVPDYSNILTRIRNISKKQENTKLLLVDVNDQIKHEKGFSYSVEADYFLDKFDKDIDPAISRIVSELYLNVDYAVDPEGIVSTDGDLIKPYFKTSFFL